MNTLDLFSLKGRTIAVIGGEGPLGKVAVQTIRDLDGEARSIDVASRADVICDVTDLGRMPQSVMISPAKGSTPTIVGCR